MVLLSSYGVGGGGNAGGSVPGVPNLEARLGQSRSQSQSGSYVNPTLFNAYQDLLARNTQSYQQAMGTYGLGTDVLGRGSAAVNADYAQLTQQVLGQLQTQGNEAANRIRDAFVQQRGTNTVNAVSRGLGNSSYVDNMQRANALSAGRAYADLYERVGGLSANAAASLGQQRLGTFAQLLGQLGGLYGQQGNAQMAHRFANTFGDVESQYGVNASVSQQFQPTAGGGGGGGFRGVGGVNDPNALRGGPPGPATYNGGVLAGVGNTYRNYGYGSGGYGTSTGGGVIDYGQSLDFDPYATDDPYGAGHAMDDWYAPYASIGDYANDYGYIDIDE